MSQYCVVTIADSGYFDLACDLLDSFRRGDNSIPFGVLDVGLSTAQVEKLRQNNVIVVLADWEFGGEIPAGLKRSYLAMLSRPFLPKYFPGFDTIVYLDADTWVQMPSAISDLMEATKGVDAVLVPELHVAFPHLYSPNSSLRNMHRATYIAGYGCEPLPPADGAVLNSGMVAARRDSALWAAWQDVLAKQVETRKHPTGPGMVPALTQRTAESHFLEQNAMNYAFYTNQFSARLVSPVYNWVCFLGMPFYDPQTEMVTEPVAPFTPIRIVHLTDLGRATTYLEDRNGRRFKKGLRWGDFKRAASALENLRHLRTSDAERGNPIPACGLISAKSALKT